LSPSEAARLEGMLIRVQKDLFESERPINVYRLEYAIPIIVQPPAPATPATSTAPAAASSPAVANKPATKTAPAAYAVPAPQTAPVAVPTPDR